MRLFTSNPQHDGDDDALNEPLFIVRNPEKARELILLGARPKKYRDVKDVDACFMFLMLDALEGALRARRRQLRMLSFVDGEALSPEARLDRQQQLLELDLTLRRLVRTLDAEVGPQPRRLP